MNVDINKATEKREWQVQWYVSDSWFQNYMRDCCWRNWDNIFFQHQNHMWQRHYWAKRCHNRKLWWLYLRRHREIEAQCAATSTQLTGGCVDETLCESVTVILCESVTVILCENVTVILCVNVTMCESVTVNDIELNLRLRVAQMEQVLSLGHGTKAVKLLPPCTLHLCYLVAIICLPWHFLADLQCQYSVSAFFILSIIKDEEQIESHSSHSKTVQL